MVNPAVELPEERRNIDSEVRQQPSITLDVHPIWKYLRGASDDVGSTLDELEYMLLRYLHLAPFVWSRTAAAPRLPASRQRHRLNWWYE